MSSYIEIQLDKQPIELYKLLKIADLVSGGGEAKILISEGYVTLNGEVEFQKRKKVYHHDVIECQGERIQLIINEDLVDLETIEPELIKKTDPISETLNDQLNQKNINKNSARKRKPISF